MPKILLLIFSLLSITIISNQSIAAQSDTAPPTDTQSTEQTILIQQRPVIAKPKSQEYFISGDMERFFQPDEMIKLLAGEQDFYALFRDDLTGRPRGVAILIPDWGSHAANNRGIESLRTHLPDLGWVTLSMTVPSTREPVHIHIPKEKVDETNSDQQNTDNEEQTENSSNNSNSNGRPTIMPYKPPLPLRTVNENQLQLYETNIKLRLQSLITEAQNHQGYFIIIAQGSSAAVIASLYNQEDLELPEALIFLSANLPDRALAAKMNQDITTTPIPTLDIYPSSSPRSLLYNAQLRRKLAKKNFKIGYRQQKVFGDISQFNQNRKLLKSVYGWLTSLGL